MKAFYETEMLAKEKVFRDPVHGYVHVQHRVILDLINTKEFQRLRRIKQLGTSSFTFHGAEHSRFNHSLGVYEIARRICDKFIRNYPSVEPEDGLWNDRERLVTLCAALLHDVGHGPFSHTFEKIFGTDHEALTIQIITSPDTEINQVLLEIGSDFPNQVASVIAKTYPNPQVVQMISSQIDADRMDYLLRDAYYSGVTYGTFDLTRILRVIRPYKKGITFEISGMHAVEDYIVSRYQMYMQVYFHSVSRGMEVVLYHLMKRAKDIYLDEQLEMHHKATFLQPFFKKNWTLKDYLRLDDGVLMTYFNHWSDDSDPTLSDLASRFLNRKPFKSVRFDRNKDMETIQLLQSLIEEMGYNPDYYSSTNNSFDLPYDLYRSGDAGSKTQIEFVQKNGAMIELSQASAIVSSLTGKMRGDERLYFPREVTHGFSREGVNLFDNLAEKFKSYIENEEIITPK
ncbi:HD domain-containing protein [Jeotgalibaca ciconiae]|uniref:HD domain-containing protein n=1 Tax=Jeotgalibaca ciconiae TaxID=2496265 RepID=A0A3Q9BJZ2_9LACT|nr:HD domain-containing protein [Jeotgalibaca ciconiae]AZP04098.1 HD domain-containing protein [Jeotgalibaca ciconiae]HJB23878.1 HD domain-containing protein [Candidatus Jeotgalibaca pullicola]